MSSRKHSRSSSADPGRELVSRRQRSRDADASMLEPEGGGVTEAGLNSAGLVAQVEALVAPLLVQHGYGLVQLELVGSSRSPILRMYIERGGDPAPVGIDDCVRVNQLLVDHEGLDALFPGAYRLEISSPGVDRPLVRPGDYGRFVGQRVQILTRVLLEGRRRFLGRLRGLEGEQVLLELAPKNVVRIPLSAIAEANLKPELAELLKQTATASRASSAET